MPDWLVRDDLTHGRLVKVMPLYPPDQADGAAVHAVWLSNRRGSLKVRAFVDYVAGHLGPAQP